MYLKILILIFFVNFMHCFNSKEYLEECFTELKNNAETINDKNADFCHDMEVNVMKKYQICQRVFKLLRDDITTGNPYTHSIYMNYKAFEHYAVCQMKSVLFQGQPAVKFMSLNCYGQPPILSSRSSSEASNNKHLNEISVFLGMNETLIVIKCLRVSSCEVIELYNSTKWQKYSNIPPDVSKVSVPRTATTDELSSAFNENLHVIRSNSYQRKLMGEYVTAPELGHLCNLLLTRSEYLVKCKSNVFNKSVQNHVKHFKTAVIIFQPFITTEQIQSNRTIDQLNKVKTDFLTYPCIRYKRAIHNARYFKIMSGADKNSVILLEPVAVKEKGKNETIWVPVELIENLHRNYVLHFEDWF